MPDNFRKPDPAKWLELYGDLLYKYTLPRVKDSVSAEDLIQETLLAGLKGLNSFKEEASEKNWLFAILKNKIIDYYRKKASGQSIVSLSDIQVAENNLFTEEGHWAERKVYNNWHTSEIPAERKELQQIIQKCKDHLKDIQQDVFTLKYLEDLKSDEICKVLNISSSNYWVLLHRARLKMRDCIEANWQNN
jgi:RNA polymerase sigma-70 factor (ECF subfamily)